MPRWAMPAPASSTNENAICVVAKMRSRRLVPGVMDRTSQRFTASTRAITFAGAFVVAFGVQVDTPLLVNRLAADDALRQAFVQQAIATHKPQTPPGDVTNDDEAKAQEYRAFLAEKGVITLPGAGGWYASLKAANYFGLLITALLLSLGAPFWYSALGNLLQLRSVLAVKDDAQRMRRIGPGSSEVFRNW